ncbi:tetratricopeptide repeat protein [Olsenella uli]|uniref:tetratricopeptide repeat protein n=1 Tax=Olsenella uli TaxID=133926 RepID=UPI0012ABD3A8|nr:tetratricopeptide repeat protein [Olsenella uli]
MDSGKWALAAFALGAAMAFTITVVVRLCIAERESERKDAEGAREEAAHAAEGSEAANPQPTLRKSEVNGTSSAAGAQDGNKAVAKADGAKDSKEATTKAASPRDGKGAIAVAAGPSVTAEASALAADSSAAEFVATPEATELATASHGAPAAPEPDAAPEPAAPEHAAPLDMEELTATLLRSADPISDLKHEAGRIRTAEAHAADDGGIEPSSLDSYLARALDEAGLFSKDAGTPDVTVVLPSRSKTFYLRVNDSSIAWPDMVRVLAVESALNRTLFAWEHLVRDAQADDGDVAGGVAETGAPRRHKPSEAEPHASDTALQNASRTASPSPSLEDCYRFNQALASSITAQLGSSPIRRASMSDVLGEWGARQAIAAGIETFRLPVRLSASFRVNLMGGDAAIAIKHVPWNVFPASVWSEELGRVIPATRQMREQAASAYAMRTALLLASHAFRCSRRLCHVFVAVSEDSPTRHACLLSGDVERERLGEFDLSAPFNPESVCRMLGFRMRLEGGVLQEVEQGFSLDSERFCPRTRYESVDLSNRILPRFESRLLGVTRVSDLAINENAHRAEMAQVLARTLGTSTEHNVREILDLTQGDKDPSVREAGERTAERLIDGSLPDSDALAFSDEFIFGDDLSRACERAASLLRAGRASEAVDVLTEALAPVDALDTYTDTDAVAWREFMGYVERTLYNRLLATDGQQVCLVPDAYYNAQLLMATALLASNRPGQALGFARRAQDLDPFCIAGTLRVVRCLEVLERRDEAAEELVRQLGRAYDPEGLGVVYYRLAFMYWRLGKTELADACYQKAAVSRASCSGAAMVELKTMRAVTGTGGVEPKDVEDVLERADIPLAPTDEILTVLFEAAQGATDAEVFPVARSFAALLGALSGDDVMHGVTNSIELDPDW